MKEEKKVPDKTKEEILEQLYVSAYDLQKLIPGITYATALSYIKSVQKEMKEKKLLVPEGQTKLALTKIIRKKFGFWEEV